MFLGDEPALRGLEVEVSLGARTLAVSSPATVLIPAGTLHSYRFVGGSGLFLNHVPAGTYQHSLLDPERQATGVED